ncbi:rhombosortase [Celerinatantimonas yamalensis]|uniref:Rhombosortase n=1 Tax=Celerinatantimonas yamalensis TaxID=559956 RepID=A0ABW9G337_9GAMM
MSVAIAVLALICQPWMDQLSWNRALIIQGQWWRLFTGVLVHADLLHYTMNMAALTVITILFAQRYSATEWLLLIILLIGLANSVLLFDSSLNDYVGLSGVLHGLVVFCALRQFRDLKWESGAILIAVSCKLILEYFHPNGLGDQHFIHMPVATSVHRTFAIIAISLYLGQKLWDRNKC